MTHRLVCTLVAAFLVLEQQNLPIDTERTLRFGEYFEFVNLNMTQVVLPSVTIVDAYRLAVYSLEN